MESRNWSNSLAFPSFPVNLANRRLRMLDALDLLKPINVAIPLGDIPANTNWHILYSLVDRWYVSCNVVGKFG